MKDTLRIIEFTENIANTHIEYVAMFNSKVISDAEAEKLIKSDMAEYDNRVVIMYKAQYDNLVR